MLTDGVIKYAKGTVMRRLLPYSWYCFCQSLERGAVQHVLTLRRLMVVVAAVVATKTKTMTTTRRNQKNMCEKKEEQGQKH